MIQELHYKLVQDVIDFINSHPEVKKKLYEEREKSYDPDLGFSQEINVNFTISGLDFSLDNKEWFPSTDSYLDLSIGDNAIFKSL